MLLVDSLVGRVGESCILPTVEKIYDEMPTASRKVCWIEPGIGKFEKVAPCLPSLILPGGFIGRKGRRILHIAYRREIYDEMPTASRKVCSIERGIGKFEKVAPCLPSLILPPFTHILMLCFFRLLLQDYGRLGQKNRRRTASTSTLILTLENSLLTKG